MPITFARSVWQGLAYEEALYYSGQSVIERDKGDGLLFLIVWDVEFFDATDHPSRSIEFEEFMGPYLIPEENANT